MAASASGRQGFSPLVGMRIRAHDELLSLPVARAPAAQQGRRGGGMVSICAHAEAGAHGGMRTDIRKRRIRAHRPRACSQVCEERRGREEEETR
eukprot:2275377-Pleurochrysis_carterae.AAC.1